MNMRIASVLLTAALAVGCAAATGPQSLPERVQFDRIGNAFTDVGSVSSPEELFRTLPRVLQRHGYFVISTEETTPEGFRFLTHWRTRPVYADESFEGVQQARTQLVVEARRRGSRYAVSLYAVSYLENWKGELFEAKPSRHVQREIRDIGRSMFLEFK